MHEWQLSYLGRRWRERPAGAVRALLDAGYDLLTARLLAARGLTSPEEAESFLDAGLHRLKPPHLLRGVDQAVRRIREAILNGETIGIYGDYDVDGQTSTALLARVFAKLGAKLVTYIPHRTKEGYGIHIPALKKLQDQGCRLVVTVDCGITSSEEAAWAEQNGLELIISDHHQPKGELPRAVAVINPHLDPEYGSSELAGCGVAFKLAEAVSEAMTGERALAHMYVELAALGTVADVVPLLGENRALVKEGLARINGKGAVPGIQALRAVAGVHGDVTAGHIAFVLAPRLNAVGRVADAAVGLALLLAPTYDEALPYARKLEEENTTRRRLEEQVTEEAHEAVRRVYDPHVDHGIVVDGPGWHPGVIGIVASRLVEAYYRPTVVLSVTGEEARGSARGIPGFDLYSALAECADLFTAFGGHQAAAGLTLPAARIGEFRERFRAVTRERLSKDDLIPVLDYDCELALEEIDLDLVARVAQLEPFGVGNPTPVVVCRDCRVDAGAVGKEKSHLKLFFHDERRGRRLEGIGFGLAKEVLPRLDAQACVDVAFVPTVNEWNGLRRPELLVKDVREAASTASPAARALTAYEELAAVHETPSAALAAGRGVGTVSCAEAVTIEAVRDALAGRAVVEARGTLGARLLEELLEHGHSVLAVPASPYLALELARELAALSPRLRASTFLWPAASVEPVGELVHRALASPPWIGVVGGLSALDGQRGAAWSELVASQQPVILLCHVPAAPVRGLAELYRVAALVPDAPLYLAYDRERSRKAAERLRAFHPDRDGLSRVYVALKEAVKGAGTADRSALVARLNERWPALRLAEAVGEALSILLELGLVTEADGRLALVEHGAKVDLARSLRYNESIAIRDHYLAFAMELTSISPAEVVDRLIERGAPWWP